MVEHFHAIHESEEKLRLLFKNAGEGIIISDAGQFRLNSFNRQLERITGYDAAQMQKLNILICAVPAMMNK